MLVLESTVGPADVPALRDRLVRLARAGPPGRTVVCDVAAVTAPTLAVVEVLARLCLAARRAGCRLRVRGSGDRLRELVALAGLGSAVELVGQAEEREEARRVQEVVDAPDLPG